MSKVYKAFKTIESGKKIITHSYQAPVSTNSLVNDNDDEIDNKFRKELLNETEIKAQDIINSARIDAAKILEDEKEKIDSWWESKRVEGEKIFKEAKEDGYNAGYLVGIEQAEKELSEQYYDRLQNSQALLQEAYKIKEEIIQEAEEEIIQLSLIIAKKIINREIELDPNLISEITREILKNTKEIEDVSIFVNPDYYIYLFNVRDDLSKGLNGRVKLSIYPDPSIESAGVVIKTSLETIDSKIDTQLEEVKKILLELSGGDKYEAKN